MYLALEEEQRKVQMRVSIAGLKLMPAERSSHWVDSGYLAWEMYPHWFNESVVPELLVQCVLCEIPLLLRRVRNFETVVAKQRALVGPAPH